MEAGPRFLEFKEAERRKLSSESSQSSDWMLPIRKTLGVIEDWSSKVNIYKVPNRLRNVKNEAYDPRVLSIGPLHHGKCELLPFEYQKWRYTLFLVQRMPNPEDNAEKCLQESGEAVKHSDEDVRGNYSDTIKCDQTALAEIMLIDGCFILELFLRYSFPVLRDENDPIFNNAWMIPTLRHDLALLENQIPFFILEKLYKIVIKHTSVGQFLTPELPHLALSFFHTGSNLNQYTNTKKCNSDCKHLLDLLRKFYLPTSSSVPRAASVCLDFKEEDPGSSVCLDVKQDPGNETKGFKYGAQKLLESGIEFEKRIRNPSKAGIFEVERGIDDELLDIKFDKGIIRIPPLYIHETTDSLFRNLIAFEQCDLRSSHHITSYAILIKSLIRSSSDFELLEGKGIIRSNLDGAKDVLNLFNSVSKEVFPKDFYFDKLCKNVNTFRESWWHWQRIKVFWKVRFYRYMAEWIQDYGSNPWKIMSVIAAIMLLVLTFLQTYYTIHS